MTKKKKKSKLLRKKKIRRYRRLALLISFLLVLLYGASFWSLHESVNIGGLEVVGNKYISTERVEEIFWKEVEGRYLFLLSKKNFLMLPKEVIKTKLRKELSVKDAFVTADPEKAMVNVIEHEVVGEYCLEDSCYLVNKNGLIFAPSPLVTMEEYMKLSGKMEGDILGQTYSDISTFQNLERITELLHQVNVNIKSISTENFQTFTLQSIQGPYLLVDSNDDPVRVVNNLKTTLEQEAIHDVQFGNLDYIDLRFGNKVYYKIK